MTTTVTHVRRYIGFGVVVLVLALLAVWRCRGSSGDEAAPGGGDDPALAGGTASAGARREARMRATPASLSGRVTDRTTGKGLPGAVVAIAEAELGAMFERARERTTIAITDASGAWTIPTVPPSTYNVTATAVGFLPGTRDRLVIAAGARETIDVALDPGGTTISGLVSDVGGGPIGGARVSALAEKQIFRAPSQLVAVTGPDGRYQLTLAPGSYLAEADHDDYTTARRRVQLQREPLALDFVLTPGARVRGQVVTRDGRPVPHAILHARSGRLRGDDAPAFADEAGEFTLTGLEPGALSITAAARGYASAEPTIVELGIGEHLEGVRVIVDRGLTVSGRVVRAGNPAQGLPGVRLGLFTMTGATAMAVEPTAEDGSFEIVGVQPASYMVFAFGEGTVADIGKPVDVVDRDVTGVIVELATGVTLSGRVEPPVEAAIRLEPASTEKIGIGNMFDLLKLAFVRGETDGHGAFTVKAVPAGTFSLVARAADGREARREVRVEGVDQSGIVLALEPRASIAGTVVDERGAPVAGVHVRARGAKPEGAIAWDGSELGASRTSATGAFTIVGLAAGAYQLVVDETALTKDKDRTFTLAAGQAIANVTLTVETRDGVIRGTVVDARQRPVPDAWVTLLRQTPEAGERVTFDSPMFEQPPVITDADGVFVVSGLRRGAYRVSVEGPRGSARASKDGVKTGDHVTLVLEPLGTLSGRVTIGGAPVTAFDFGCELQQAAPTPAADPDEGGGVITPRRRFARPDGSYQLERLAPGLYKCTATADRGTATAAVRVPSGPATLDLALVAHASITGRVVHASRGGPLAGLGVTAINADAPNDMVGQMLAGNVPKTDATGRFVIERVPAGKVHVAVMPSDDMSPLAEREVVLKPGERLDLGTIAVVPPRGEDAGTLGLSCAIDDDKLLVGVVKADGPAAAAGIQEGDRIVSIDGQPVAQLGAEAGKQLVSPGYVAIGQRVQLGLERAGKPVQASVVAVKW